MFERLKIENKRIVTFLILLFIGVALVLKFVNVFNAPAHWDTGLYLNIAVGYLERGILTPLMWRFNPEWNIVTGSGSGYGVFLIIGWTKLFGISILSGHLLMYILGVINLPVIYLLGKRFYNSHEAGLWTMGFFALSGMFAHDFYVRMDTPNILVCSLILLLHWDAMQRNKWWLHFAVGVALVVALEVHILAAIYVGGIGVYYAIHYLRQLMREKRFLLWSPAIAFGIGLALAAGIYYLHHVAPNPDLYFMIPRNCGICSAFSPLKEMERWYWWFSFQPFLLIGLTVISIWSAIRRHTAMDRDFLALLGGGLIVFVVLNPPAGEQYTGHLLPLFALGVGGLFAQGINLKRPQLPALRVMGVLLSLSAVVILAQKTYFVYSREYSSPLLIDYAFVGTVEEQQADIDYIRDNIPKDTVIVGRETQYLDLIDYHYFISNQSTERLGLSQRHESYIDFWKREKPQVFMGNIEKDPNIQQYIALNGNFVEVIPNLWVDRTLVKHTEAS